MESVNLSEFGHELVRVILRWAVRAQPKDSYVASLLIRAPVTVGSRDEL